MSKARKQLKLLTQRNFIEECSNKGGVINEIRLEVITCFLGKNLNTPRDNSEFIKQYYSLKESIKVLGMINLRLSLYLNAYCRKYCPNLNDALMSRIMKVFLMRKLSEFLTITHQFSNRTASTSNSNTRRLYPYSSQLQQRVTYDTHCPSIGKQIIIKKKGSLIKSLENIITCNQSIYNKKHQNMFLSSLPTYKQCARECSSSLCLIIPSLNEHKEKISSKKSLLIGNRKGKGSMNVIDKYILNINKHLNKKKGGLGTISKAGALKLTQRRKANELKPEAPFHSQKQMSLYTLFLNNYLNQIGKEKKKETDASLRQTKQNTSQSTGKFHFFRLRKTLAPLERDRFVVNKLSNIFIKNKILTKFRATNELNT